MIPIVSEAHKKSIANGALMLDRCAVTAYGIDLREGRLGSPNANMDVAYGVEGAGGEFDAAVHDSNLLVVPFQIGPQQFAMFSQNQHSPVGGPEIMQKGSGLFVELALWLEKVLAAQNEFGAGATVVSQKRRVFDPPSQPGQLGG